MLQEHLKLHDTVDLNNLTFTEWQQAGKDTARRQNAPTKSIVIVKDQVKMGYFFLHLCTGAQENFCAFTREDELEGEDYRQPIKGGFIWLHYAFFFKIWGFFQLIE